MSVGEYCIYDVCPLCKGATVSVTRTLCTSRARYLGCRDTQAEHLHMVCGGCGHQWLTKCRPPKLTAGLVFE